ncbi:fibronectin type III domain-containing protein [Faecalibacter sp. LW9]|uniref:fibronectin type III domain-containing protein n=1 Tax=Faecalibacter sp. LW9 TaxID=3103144 RepID=UPI002AFEA9E6|nr:fibronectin type III domain-containing protein [Faecalibacter sp. LW9]
MMNNYSSSKISRKKNSNEFFNQLKRNFRSGVGTLLFAATPAAFLYAQTNPVPQQVPYTQNFDNLTGANPSYPAGWAGWRLDGNLNTNFAALPVADATFGVGNNNTTAPGIYDMVGKLGFLTTAGQRTAPALAIKTLEKKNIVVKYKINVQRVNSNRGLAVKLQYRVGQTGNFTDVNESLFEYYGAGEGANIGTGVAALETHEREVTLPAEVELQPEVQLRWVVARTVNNQGSGDNHSFSIDDVIIEGTTPPDLPVPFPYRDQFNHDTWVINNGTDQINRFKIGTPATASGITFADSKLYITNAFNSDTSGPTYNAGITDTYAYKDIIIPEGITTAKLSFKWLAKGESTYDFGRFYLVPASTTPPSNGTGISSNGTTAVPNSFYNARLTRSSNYFLLNEPNFSGSGAFENIAYEYRDNMVDLSGFAGQTIRAVFYWKNDSSLQNNPSLIIDDFVLDYTPTCLNPTFTATTNIEGRSAQLNWESTGNNFDYYISTSPSAPTETTTPTGNTQSNSVVVTGLNATTQYYAWVRTICGPNDVSEWSSSTTFTTTISCPAPTELTNTAVGSNSAAITWTSSAQEFKYYVSTTNTAPTAETEGTTVTQNSATLTGLTPGTTYYWWVKAVCETDDVSAWSSVQTFSTSQANTAFPVIDNFNSTSDWTSFGRSTTTGTQSNQISKFYINTPTSITLGSGTTAGTLTFGDGKLFVSYDAANLSPSYTNYSLAYAYKDVTLPADLTIANLSFKWMFKGEGVADYARFLIIPTTQPLDNGVAIGNSTTAFNNIYTFNNNPYQSSTANKTLISYPSAANTIFNGAFESKAHVYEDLAVDLSQYAGQTVRLLFYFRADLSIINNPSLIIDDFKFDYPAACAAPTAVTSTNVTAKTADVSWTASVSDPANGYEYYYSTNSTTPEDTVDATGTSTGTTTTLSGLTPDATYYVWVRSVCSPTSKSSWSTTVHSFTTAIACEAPTAPVTSDITTNSATLGWTSTAENFEYILSTTNIEPTLDSEGTAVTENTVTVNDLTPNTTYYWFVRTNCGTEDGPSRWTTVSTFTTAQNPAAFPYVDNFDEAQWVFINGTQTNKFYVGTPETANGVTYADNKLFVSENGTTNTYATSASSVYAYRDITLPTDLTNAKISFDWIYKGEGGTGSGTPYDYGRFYIVPTSVLPTAGTNLGFLEEIPNAIYSLRNNTVPVDRRNYLLYNPSASYEGAFEEIAHHYNDQVIDLSEFAGQTVRMVFFFRNDSGIYPPSLAIDNFVIDYTPNCIQPTQLTASNISDSEATISWVGNTEGYQYHVSTTNEAPTADFVGTASSTTTIDLENLTANTRYYWWVKSICEDSTSTWTAGEPFTTSRSTQSFPFEDTFESENWTLVNGTQANKFMIGTPIESALTFTNNALFISNNTTSNTYDNTSASATFAYVDVQLPSDITTANVNFNWYAKGESTFDFGRFFIVPTSYLPVAGTTIYATGTIANQIFGSNKLNLATGTSTSFENAQSTFTSTAIDVSAFAGQKVRLVFYWKNDSSLGTQPPLAIDNFYFGPSEDLSTGNLVKGDFVYYPNPVQNELNIKGDQMISSVELFNLTGQVMNQVKVNAKSYTLNTSKLTAGVYMVRVAFENGTTKTVKIIKK